MRKRNREEKDVDEEEEQRGREGMGSKDYGGFLVRLVVRVSFFMWYIINVV